MAEEAVEEVSDGVEISSKRSRRGCCRPSAGRPSTWKATFPGRIAKGQRQHWKRVGKGVRAKFRIEGTDGFYVLAGSIERGVTFHKLRVGKEGQWLC